MRLFCAILFVVSLSNPGLLQAKGSQRIKDVKVKGLQRISKQAILQNIRSNKGQKLLAATVQEDVRRLYKLARFQDIQVEAQQSPSGVTLYFILQEYPAIRKVRLKGNKAVTDKDIKEVMNLRKNSVFRKTDLARNVEKIKELYLTKGFSLARVTSEIKRPKSRRLRKRFVDITIYVQEYSKIRISQINFVGNHHIASAKLRQSVYHAEHDLLNWALGRSTYQKALMRRDQAILRLVYMNHGFATAKISPPQVSLHPIKNSVYITYRIHEGPKFRYGKVRVSNVSKKVARLLKNKMNIKPGDVFNQEKLYKENILKLMRYYQNRGYAYANVNPRSRIHFKKRIIDLAMHIEKGKRQTIERIEIAGNATTLDKVIRRELEVFEGDTYNITKLQLSQRRVFALGYFDKTHPLFGVKVVSRTGSTPNRIILRFIVKEKSTGNIQAGGGWSSQGPFASAQFAKNNIFGTGRYFSFNAQLSFENYTLQTQFVDPRFLDTRWTFAFSLFNTQQNYQNILNLNLRQFNTGGSISGGYTFRNDLSFLLTYKLERISFGTTEDTTLTNLGLINLFTGNREATWTGSLKLSLRYDKRNNRLNPTQGHFQSINIEHANRYLISDTEFTRISLNSRWYKSLPYDLVLKFNARVGWLISQSSQGLSALQRYRQGGIQTIRGYPDFSIGPKRFYPNSASSAHNLSEFNWGGNKEFQFNAELEFPLVKRAGLRGVIFFDAGNVFDNNEYLFQNKRNPNLPLGLLSSVGFGVRWNSPFGTMRLELGFPLTPRAGDPSYRVHFSIGPSF